MFLLIGIPGVAKTLLVKIISHIWGLEFSRLQFTPDLLPSDITGVEILQQEVSKSNIVRKKMDFLKGPIFANIILADEINRTPAKTQSALLESMEERQVTAGGKRFSMLEPFMIMATQNPIELEGTYPLPEAQLDRFVISINIPYPTFEDEKKIAILRYNIEEDLQSIKPLQIMKSISKWQSIVSDVLIPESVLEFIVTSIRNTRPGFDFPFANKFGEIGAGPRATQHLIRMAQAVALLNKETILKKEHIEKVYQNVLKHRVKLNYIAISENITVQEYLKKCFF